MPLKRCDFFPSKNIFLSLYPLKSSQNPCFKKGDSLIAFPEKMGASKFPLLSFNTITLQEVNGASYTNIKDSNFDCGRYKTYCEIQEDCTEEFLTQGIDGKKPRDVSYEGWGNEIKETPGCSTTLINDRFAISAAHCFKSFGFPQDIKDGLREARGITIR